MRTTTRTLPVALLLLAGCGGGSESGAPAAKPASSTPAAAPAAAPAQAPAAAPAADTAPAATEAELTAIDQLPTTEQLEQKLDQTVTEQNADAEFEKLQQEIDKEEEGG